MLRVPRLVITALLALTASAAVIPDAWQDQSQELTFNICPELSVKCVLDGDWRHPIGYLGKRPFCQKGIRCNQCDEEGNTWDCNREFKECHRSCEAYGPIPV